MTYFRDIHTYLHQSSLLIQAYPQQTRITTKYSLPRKSKSTNKDDTAVTETETEAAKVKRDPSATLTLKTYHPDSGICLKYRTDKAAEVGRLMSGLGRLAKGEVIDLPTSDNDSHLEDNSPAHDSSPVNTHRAERGASVESGPAMLTLSESLLHDQSFVSALLTKLEGERSKNLEGLREDDKQME